MFTLAVCAEMIFRDLPLEARVRRIAALGFDWLWLGIALFGDLVSYSGSGYGNRDRIPGY